MVLKALYKVLTSKQLRVSSITSNLQIKKLRE